MGCSESKKHQIAFQNVLSTPLSKNPYEFKGLIHDIKVKHLQEISDQIQNPKNKNKIDVTVQQIIKSHKPFNDNIDSILENLNSSISKKLTKEQLQNAKLWEVCAWSDKGQDTLLDGKVASAKLDTSCNSLGFQKFYDLEMFKAYKDYQYAEDKNFEILLNDPIQTLYQILNYSQIILLDSFQLNQSSFKKTEELIEIYQKHLEKVAKEKLIYSEQSFNSVKNNQTQQNNLSIDEKVKKVISKVQEYKYIGLSEIDKKFYDSCVKNQGHEYKFYPAVYPKDEVTKQDAEFITLLMAAKSQKVTHIQTIFDNRISIYNIEGKQLILVHLPSGDDADGRQKYLNQILTYMKPGKAIIMGDFNEDMTVDSQIVKILQEQKFLLGELKKTVYKERSAIQQQVNKMSKKDHTAKDGIFANTIKIDQEIKPHPLSDHAIVMIENEF